MTAAVWQSTGGHMPPPPPPGPNPAVTPCECGHFRRDHVNSMGDCYDPAAPCRCTTFRPLLPTRSLP